MSLRLTPQQDWLFAKILYKKAHGLLPTRARIHRQRANLLLALVQVSARERGLEPARGAREMIEELRERLRAQDGPAKVHYAACGQVEADRHRT